MEQVETAACVNGEGWIVLLLPIAIGLAIAAFKLWEAIGDVRHEERMRASWKSGELADSHRYFREGVAASLAHCVVLLRSTKGESLSAVTQAVVSVRKDLEAQLKALVPTDTRDAMLEQARRAVEDQLAREAQA